MSDYRLHPLRATASKRCEHIITDEFTFTLQTKIIENGVYSEENPSGILNLAISENNLYQDILLERLSRPDVLSYQYHHQNYPISYGTLELRTAAANYATYYFKAAEPLHPDNFVVTNGVTGALDLISYVLGDSEDVFLLPTPSYVRIPTDIKERSHVFVHEIPLSSKLEPQDTEPFQLTARKVERAIEEGREQGKNIRALLLVNPHNPTGNVLPEETLMEILHVCKRYELHVVANEIYGLSRWNNNTDFTSITSINDLPDPMRTHFLFGLSKDLGLAGFRVGFIHTKNPVVLKALQKLAFYSGLPSTIQHSAAALLNDRDWLENTLFPESYSRTRRAYGRACEWMEKLGIPFHPVQTSFFIWADLRKFLPEATKDAEFDLSESLMKEYNLAIAPGYEYYSAESGWFRLVFTVSQTTFDEGMRRLQKCLQSRSSLSPQKQRRPSFA